VVTNNAASTQPPRELVDLFRTLAPDYENVHRGQSAASQLTTALFEDAYDTIARFINAPSRSNIVITRKKISGNPAAMEQKEALPFRRRFMTFIQMRDALAGEMDRAIEAFEPAGIQPSGGWIPLDISPPRTGLRANQPDHLVPRFGEGGNESFAYEPGGA
jgi:hypothetical protein